MILLTVGGEITSKQNVSIRPGKKGKSGGTKRQYTSKTGKSGHVSPAIVEKYLAGIHFPAEKKDLIDKAADKKAPENVMEILKKLSSKTYKSPIDITKEIGKIE